MINIRPFQKTDAAVFKALNIAWLEKYFYVEAYDREVLSHPKKYILDKGGYIFMVDYKGDTIGTMALLKHPNEIYEFTKMAVAPDLQGLGIGQKMMAYVIAFAKAQDLKGLILYSNTKLENAIYIYRKYGFIEIPQEQEVIYKRSNIKMKYPL
ncbi:MAG: GNAT family N-acetyltransferase [Cytophagaceae bacterium]|nr:GNAT family N-acetyltransferase [Cytophagaceae bacterium]